MTAAAIGIIVVNWNGWADTIECLEAVFQMHDHTGPVVVVDNGSEDNSVNYIQAWAGGLLCALPQTSNELIRRLVIPPRAKPLACKLIADTQQEAAVAHDDMLYIIALSSNTGFAQANNVGIEFLSCNRDIEWFWLINNDALPDRDCFRQTLSALSEGARAPQLAGNVLLEYWQPQTIQAIGGHFNPLTMSSSHIQSGTDASALERLPATVPVSYPVGAGLLISRSFVEQYGTLSRDYFLYHEEIDLAIRCKSPAAIFAISSAKVFHKGGAASLGSNDRRARSLTADYYMIRGRILLARKISTLAFCVTLLVTITAVIRRTVRSRPGALGNSIMAAIDGMKGITDKRR